MKDCHKIVLLISLKTFNDFYDILNINNYVLFINCIFSNILIYFQLSYEFKMIRLKSLDKCLIL